MKLRFVASVTILYLDQALRRATDLVSLISVHSNSVDRVMHLLQDSNCHSCCLAVKLTVINKSESQSPSVDR